MSDICEFLRRQLDAGDWTIGQVRVSPGITLRHVDDEFAAALELFTRPEDAREIAKYDEAGIYRPLKTAPNLRRGWELRLNDVEALRLALDFFYPAALGTWLAFECDQLKPVFLRETLARQSGMYRVTQLIRDDQAASLIATVCDEGCLRHRLWAIDSGAERLASSTEAVPIFCAEACNLLVAACRPLAKENSPKSA